MTDNLLNDDMDIMLSQVADNISFFFLLKFWCGKSEAVFQHSWCARRQLLFERGVTQIWSLFFIAKLIICLVWIKQIDSLIVKIKNCSCVFMSSAWTNTSGSLCQSFCLIYTQVLLARTTPLLLTFGLQTYFH
jgi:hypothetical protein